MAKPKRQEGDWWVAAYDGDRYVLYEIFADGKQKHLGSVCNGWFSLTRDSLITPEQAIALAKGRGKGTH